MSDLVLLVLNSGETVLGEATDGNDFDGFTLSDIVTFAPNPQGQGAITVPYLPFSEESAADFKEEDIRHVLTPNAELKSYYAKQFGKIDVPDPQIII